MAYIYGRPPVERGEDVLEDAAKEEDPPSSLFGSLALLEPHGGIQRTFGLSARDVSEQGSCGDECGDGGYGNEGLQRFLLLAV